MTVSGLSRSSWNVFPVMPHDLLFSVDFVTNWNIKYKPVQGGFLVLRPDKSVYDELVAIVRK